MWLQKTHYIIAASALSIYVAIYPEIRITDTNSACQSASAVIVTQAECREIRLRCM